MTTRPPNDRPALALSRITTDRRRQVLALALALEGPARRRWPPLAVVPVLALLALLALLVR